MKHSLHRPGPVAWALAVLSAASGTLVYILTAAGPGSGYANLLWGSAYGLGYLVLSLIVSPTPGFGGIIYWLVGTFAWPFVLTVALARCLQALIQSVSRKIVIILWVASNFLIFPMAQAHGTFVYYLPIYGIFLEQL